MTTQLDIALADVDPSRPERQETFDRRLLIDVAGRSDVEMEPVGARLLLRDRLEQDREPGSIRRHETDLTVGLVDLPTQRLGPEAREPVRVVRIDAELDEPRCRPRLRHPIPDSRFPTPTPPEQFPTTGAQATARPS